MNDGRHDFDFYFGRWAVRVQRLTTVLAGCDEWVEYDATDESEPILDGLGCLDRFETAWDGGRIGMALRLFDPQTKQWSIYWADSRGGVLDAPVVGAFSDGVGTFVGHDQHAGRPILVRNVWRDITPMSVRWEQALSADDGSTWEANCVMGMTRAG
jgi:hypothetical protein